MENLRLSILVSVALHAMFIGLLIWGAFHFREAQFTQAGGGGGSGGGIVRVWIAEENSLPFVRGGPGWGRPLPQRSTPSYSPLQRGSVTSETTSTLESKKGDGEGSGDGAGSGAGSGAGIGGDPGGDPRLTKIWKRINNSKHYPQIAKRKGLEGMPRVTFAIGEDGKLKWVGIASSCGEATLDEAAMETVRRAAPYPFYPEPITLTVRYSLEE